MAQNLRLALRRLLASPGFAAVAIGTLALGIGANAAMFSVVRAVLLAPLPYAAPDQLVRVLGFDTDEAELGNLSPADFLDFARDTSTLHADGRSRLRRLGDDQQRHRRRRTRRHGEGHRGLLPDSWRAADAGPPVHAATRTCPTRAPVALISDGFWRRRFAADPGIVGAVIRVNAQPYTVIGVLPASYRHVEEDPDRSADVFLPFGFDPATANRGGHFIRGVGRLAPAPRSSRPAPISPPSPPGSSSSSRPATTADGAGRRRCSSRWSPAPAAACWCWPRPSDWCCSSPAPTSPTCCSPPGPARQREFAVRAALGAGRRRLIGQLLAESLVLSALGGVAGLALAAWGTRAATLLAAAAIPRTADIRVDGTVLAFVALAAVIAAVLFGLAPALHLSSTSMHVTLKEGGRTPGTFVPQRVRDVFMGAQVALAVVLLVGGHAAGAQPVAAAGRAAGLLARPRHRHGRVAADRRLSRGQPDPVLPAPAGAGPDACPAWTRSAP